MNLKTLFLLTTVIGSGLFATFLKTRNRGQQAPAEQEQQAILVSAKELFVGTTLNKENLSVLIRKKIVNKADVPQFAILNEDELFGKSVNRDLKADECLTVTNTIRQIGCFAATDNFIFTLKLPYESVGPWVRAGLRVNVKCTHRPPGSQVVRHLDLLPDMHVLAVDETDKPRPDTGCRMIMISVTLEGSLEEMHRLQMALDAGAQLRLIISVEKSGTFVKPTDEELCAFFGGTANEKQNRPDPIK